jgi:hypothetical protein
MLKYADGVLLDLILLGLRQGRFSLLSDRPCPHEILEARRGALKTDSNALVFLINARWTWGIQWAL